MKLLKDIYFIVLMIVLILSLITIPVAPIIGIWDITPTTIELFSLKLFVTGVLGLLIVIFLLDTTIKD